MPAVKTYVRVNFENYPSTNTPLNATNLNKVDKGIDDLDDLLVTARNNIETLQSNATTDEANILALQGSVAALNGFTYYPAGEVDLVALVADDSFYKDANGKYVLANSATGQSMIDNVTYKALASTEDTRGEVGADSASPFSGDKDWTLIIKVKGWYSTNMNGGDVTQNMKIQHINGVTSITEYASGRGPDRYSGSSTQNVWGGYNCEFVSFDYDD